MYPYIPNTPEDEKIMLDSIGLSSVDDLFDDVPEEVKLKRRLNINSPMSEMEVLNRLKALSKKNISTEDMVCFLGAGAYDHYIPSVVKYVISKPEFYTAYTPYQAEISQGTLQSVFEYQSMICSLTGMDAANASMYDVGTAAQEAGFMACEITRRKSVVVSKSVHPEVRKVLKTYMKFRQIEVVEADLKDGVTDIEKLQKIINENTAGIIVQNPNFFGIIEDFSEIENIIHRNKGLMIMSVDPISLGILKTPGEWGADIAIGDGQSLGNSLNFGGPHLGFMATKSKFMRKLPGRIVGQTEDKDGKRAFVLTLQAREQHIRREKASSNICSNEQLNALAATVYMTAMGKEGLREVALQCISKSHYALKKIIDTGKFQLLFDKPFFMEFCLKSKYDGTKINEELLKKNIIGGYELEREYPEYKNSVLLCVTEKRTKDEIDILADALEGIK